MSHSMAPLAHNRPASAGTSRISCSGQGHDKRDILYVKIPFCNAHGKQCPSIRSTVNVLKESRGIQKYIVCPRCRFFFSVKPGVRSINNQDVRYLETFLSVYFSYSNHTFNTPTKCT